MYVFYDKDGEIKGMAPSQNDFSDPNWSSAMFPLEEVELFILGKKNSFNYRVKKIKNLAGEKFILSEKLIHVTYTRTLDYYLKEVEAPESHVTTITVTNQKTDKIFIIEFSQEFKLLCEDNKKVLEYILSEDVISIYITKKHNPYHLLYKINFSPIELLEKGSLTFNYEDVIENASAYSKKAGCGYVEINRVIRTLDNYVSETENPTPDNIIIDITNQIIDKAFVIKLSKNFRLLCENNKKLFEDTLGTDMIPVYITEKHNPYHLLFKMNFSPAELLEKDNLIFNYDAIENPSIYIKKIKYGYREVSALDNWLGEIEKPRTNITTINIINQKTDKVFIIEFSKKPTIFDDEDIISTDIIPIYITKKHNPYHLLFTMNFSPLELREKNRLYFNYDGIIENTSAYTKKIVDRVGYREVVNDV